MHYSIGFCNMSTIANSIMDRILALHDSLVIELDNEHAASAISPHLICLAIVFPAKERPATRLIQTERIPRRQIVIRFRFISKFAVTGIQQRTWIANVYRHSKPILPAV